MKKILVISVFLYGCVYEVPGVCTNMDENKTLCFSRRDIDFLTRQNISAEAVYNFSLDNKKHTCSKINTDKIIKDEYGKKFESDKDIMLCSDNIVEDYWYDKRKKDEQYKLEQFNIEVKKRFGMGLCKFPSIWYYLSDLYLTGVYSKPPFHKLPQDCIVGTGYFGFNILQQVSEGTILVSKSYNDVGLLFVEKNKKLLKFNEDSDVEIKGFFTITGNYTYKNIFGKTVIIPKAKYLGDYIKNE